MELTRPASHYTRVSGKLKVAAHNNTYEVDGDVAYLHIHRPQAREIIKVTIDREDLARVLDVCPWRLLTGRCNVNYIAFTTPGTGQNILLHRLIMRTPEDLKCDIMTPGFDYRKTNLRNVGRDIFYLTTDRIRRPGKSGIIGVYQCRRKTVVRWEACVIRNNKRNYLGLYDTAEQAQKARTDWLEARGT